MSHRKVKSRAERLAVALWNLERRQYRGLEEQPAFYEYADGTQEPMPLHKQDLEHRRYWLARARRLLRAVT